jgi:hypothetical protein
MVTNRSGYGIAFLGLVKRGLGALRRLSVGGRVRLGTVGSPTPKKVPPNIEGEAFCVRL